MTKDEILQCKVPSEVWAAMESNLDFKKDPEIWLHLNHLTFPKQKAAIEEFYGYYDPELHVDCSKRKT